MVSREPEASSRINFVTFLSEFLSETKPQIYISLFDFAAITDAIDFNILDSGRFEIILFNFENRFENNALKPDTPSAEVTFDEGSNKTLCSFSIL